MTRSRTLLAAAVLAIPLSFASAAPAFAVTYTPTTWGQLQANVSSATAADTVALGNHILAPNGQRLEVALGETLNLDLNGYTLTIPAAPNEDAAVRVPAGTRLEITATGGGTLVARGGSSGAGIGGDHGEDGGTVTIHGGTILATAAGPGGGAGIGGGGAGGAGGTLTVHGGVVTATSEGGMVGGAGIGGGEASPGGTVVITGGVVVATGGNGSPGMGGGAGIGGGGSIGYLTNGGAGATVTISGGSVEAFGGTSPGTLAGGGAGIGGGGSGVVASGGAGGSVSVEAPATPDSHTTGGAGANGALGGVGATISAIPTTTDGYFHTVVAANGTTDGPASSVSITFQFRVSFDSAGGSPVADQYVDVGAFASVPTTTRNGFDFTGWRLGTATGPTWDGSAPVTASITVVATWVEVDYSLLEDATANALPVEAADEYTPDSWSDYRAALLDAENLLIRVPSGSQAEVDAALAALIDAEGQLVLRADFTELEQSIDRAEALPVQGGAAGEFDYEEWNGLSAAHDDLLVELSDGRDVYDDKNSTQTEVDTAAAALLENVHRVEAGIALAETVIEIDGLGLTGSDYTADSWAALNDALTDATTALDTAPMPNSTLISELQTDLGDAWHALVTMQSVPGLDAVVSGPHAMGDDPVTLPTITDGGAAVTYMVDVASAAVCAIVDDGLVFTGFGDCLVHWSALAVGSFPAASGAATIATGPGLQLIHNGVQLSDGDVLGVGQTVTARGAGLEPGSTVRVGLGSGQLGEVTVAGDGTASVTFTVPGDAELGGNTIRAVGISSIDQSTLVRTVAVAVTALPVPALPVTGAETARYLTAGVLLLLVGGGALVLGARRHQVSEFTLKVTD